MVLALAQDARSEVLELLKAVQEDISSLFKLSALVEKVTYRDDYAIAGPAIHDTHILHKELEVRDIQDHFPRLKGSVWLLQRLVQANSARRKYLKHRAFHHDRVPVSSQHVLRQGDDDEVSMEDKILLIHHSDQISMADVNITGLGSLQEEDEDDHVSQASRDHSIPEISLNQIPTVHTLEELCQDGEVFVCPYCKDKQTMKTEAAWRRHVFSDLKAYVCLAEDCELYMFRSVEAWMNHQLSEHLAVWSCPLCREHHPFPSAQLFRAHMRLGHAADFSEEQLSQLTTSTKHSLDSIRASECQFCDWALILKDADQLASSTGDIHVTLEEYRHHVCSHLEKLALTALITTATMQRLCIDELEPTPQADTIAMRANSSSAGPLSLIMSSKSAPHRDESPNCAYTKLRHWDNYYGKKSTSN
ncbi:hypothetical protein D6D19_02369 [Aureobasidium pullulans]|uniref:C2H2-type domain-containing protein n=1 Tax=Aureobasidium pullulans TaxID=5580 RepID=A0A4S9ADC4_AURPU|nr:hypothetical protein D6D19_02369 [Aureobasidium pullulans]